MECSVCYECEARCEFVCGHSFCYQCVKNWYQKGTPTCPMCRNGMCFRGITKIKKIWDDEKREKILEGIIEELLGHIEDYEEYEYGVDMLEIMYDRYNLMMENFPEINDESFEFILNNTWIGLNNFQEKIYYEVPTFMRYLMIPKTSYGVKIGSGT